ncbi:MAG: hypothetical protein GY817_02615 [bacterium]|nr:hypothetical protein [bacterium]
MGDSISGRYRVNDKNHQVDHEKLHSYLKSPDGKRDLSATVSSHNEVLKDIIKQVEYFKDENNKLKEDIKSLQKEVSKLKKKKK